MAGLRGFHSNYKGASFGYRLKELRWQLHYAWQRAWRGYDDIEVFDFCFTFMERIVPILKDYRENNVSLWIENRGTNQYKELTRDQTNEIIDRMIYLAENSNADGWLDANLDPYNKTDIPKIEEWQRNGRQNEKEFLKIFSEYFPQMWY